MQTGKWIVELWHVQVRMQAEGKLPAGTPKRYPSAMAAYGIIIKWVLRRFGGYLLITERTCTASSSGAQNPDSTDSPYTFTTHVTCMCHMLRIAFLAGSSLMPQPAGPAPAWLGRLVSCRHWKR